jgi:hypothetical protein
MGTRIGTAERSAPADGIDDGRTVRMDGDAGQLCAGVALAGIHPRLPTVGRPVDPFLVLGSDPHDVGVARVNRQRKDRDLVQRRPCPRGDTLVPLNPRDAAAVALVDAAGVVGDEHLVVESGVDANVIAQPATRPARPVLYVAWRGGGAGWTGHHDIVDIHLGTLQELKGKAAEQERILQVGEIDRQFLVHIDLDGCALVSFVDPPLERSGRRGCP